MATSSVLLINDVLNALPKSRNVPLLQEELQEIIVVTTVNMGRGKRKAVVAKPEASCLQKPKLTSVATERKLLQESPIKVPKITTYYSLAANKNGVLDWAPAVDIAQMPYAELNGLDDVNSNYHCDKTTSAEPLGENVQAVLSMSADGSDLQAPNPEEFSPSSVIKKLAISKRKPKKRTAAAVPKKDSDKPNLRKRLIATSDANNNNNRHLTEFFPIRRSCRQTRSNLMKEKQKIVEETILSGKEESLEVRHIIGKGRGVVATRAFQKGDFVVEYSGELIDTEEAKKRELKYAQDQNAGCYMYYFIHNNQKYCVDATAESERFGRLVNHSRCGNLVTKAFVINDDPHLILVAKKDIEAGEELLYDYGDRSKQSLEAHPWLST